VKSDAQMMLRKFVLNNDADAFSGLSKQYASLVYGVCWRILQDEHKAADATQETFLQLVRHAHKIHGSVAAWLHRVARGKAIDIIRKDKRQKELKQKFYTELGDEQQSWRQLSLHIDEALNQLDSARRDILIEHYLENRSMRDIALRKGISQATVSRKANTALQMLRKRLGALGLVVSTTVMSDMLAESSAQAAPLAVMRSLGKMGMAGHGTGLGCIGKTVYLVGSLDLVPKTVVAVAVITLGTLPFVNHLDRDQEAPHTASVNAAQNGDQNELSALAVSSTGSIDPQGENSEQDNLQPQKDVSASASDMRSTSKQAVPKVVLDEPTFFRFSGPSEAPPKAGPLTIKVDMPRDTVKTFVGLLGIQDVNRIETCFLPGSEGSNYWQEIFKGSTPAFAELKQVFLALDLPVEITQIWQEEDRVGVTWICNVTEELELKVLKRQFIPWDVYTLQVELRYVDGKWLINELWSE